MSAGTSAVAGPELRTAMGHFATGVTIVAATVDGEPRGGTANAVASVSLDPPLVLVCLRHGSGTLASLRTAGTFALNVLGHGQEELARRFAQAPPAERFAGRGWHHGRHGAPVLDGAVATLECAVHEVADGGDHAVVFGRVLAVGHPDRHAEPLVFFRGRFRRLHPGERA
jgi:flavin reductase (DIM6/NTAB) family NADH-FMN oxidoreductase RutF